MNVSDLKKEKEEKDEDKYLHVMTSAADIRLWIVDASTEHTASDGRR